MSQASVMAAIGTTFGGTLQTDPDTGQRRYTGGPITYLGTLYIGYPADFPETAFYEGQDPGARFGAIAIVTLEEPTEQRMSLGPRGWWRVAHPVTFKLYHKAAGKHAEDARANLRILQQELRDLLRADTTLGGQVFSIGEHDAQPSGATGTGHHFKTGKTATAGGKHETRSDWSLVAVEYVQGGAA
jgi:hypothetical protein